MRWVTRSMYVSSSSERKIGSRMTESTEATSAASSASQNESTLIEFGTMSAASLNITASSTSTNSRPVISVNGSGMAATSGGNTALRTAMTAAARNAPRQPSTDTPGTTHAAK